jgi:hypothetical protein
MKKYYKVCRGWGEDFVSIEEKDLPRAIIAQLTGSVLLAGGTIAGNKIEMIVPDYHKTMGWNYAHRLEPDDYAEIKNTVGNMQNIIGIVSAKIKYLGETKQMHLASQIQVEDIIREHTNIQNDPRLKALSEGLVDKFKI